MTEDSSRKLGAVISTWRVSAGLSQANLAEALHTQQTTVSKIESGTYRLGALQLLEILDACGLRLEDVADDIQDATRVEGRPLWERIDE